MAEPSASGETERNERLCEFLIAGQPDALIGVDADGTIAIWNPAAERMAGYTAGESVGQPFDRLLPEKEQGLLSTLGASDETRQTRELDLVAKGDQHVRVNVTLTVLRDDDKRVVGFAVALREAKAVPTLEAQLGADPFRGIAESATMGIITIDEDSNIIYANPGTERIFGYNRDELIGKRVTQLLPEEKRPQHLAGIKNFLATGKRKLPWDGAELVALSKDGHEIPIQLTLSDYVHDGKHYFSAGVIDISERKRMEGELKRAMRRLELEKEQTPVAVIDWDTSLNILDWNPAAERIFGYRREDAVGKGIGFLSEKRERAQSEAALRALLNRQGGERITLQNITKDDRLKLCEWYNTALVADDGSVIGGVSLVQDITESKQVEQQSRRQMEQLHALRTIDLAITASLDLEVTLTVLLDLVIAQLGVDAADVLLLHPYTQRLEYSTGRGFRTAGIQRTELRLGECSAGRAALDRRTVVVPTLRTNREFTRAALLEGDEFEAHASAPLIAKGKVVGVLEVFHRSPLRPEPDWFHFLDTLAGQAAIAIESARLFADLEKTNLELVLAYDTTLEGWAQALDLRDAVTEGHSRRVTDMTIRLAKELGIDDADLVNIRRGALLHDIGKMGIPDRILHKNGALSDEEWTIMRKHPVYAQQFLEPIEFLRAAIDIPYSHHEHWDGSGYPQGLKEQAIPLSARIFAVVDVWDALTMVRPYHDAWTPSQARREIGKMSGTHLDPQVVDVFLNMEWSTAPTSWNKP
ncbi:MAG TPA: PAS domain S-box protein [Gemmatimonadaceae bacterium]